MQALGNCQQPLTHRGAINIQPSRTTGAGGLARPGTWRTSDYQNLLPAAGQGGYSDIAGRGGGFGGGGNGSGNSNNYDGHQFQFPLDQNFNYSNFYGGDTFNVAGNGSFDNVSANNLQAGDVVVRSITVRQGGDDSPSGGSGFGSGFSGVNLSNNNPDGISGSIPTPGVRQPASTEVTTYLKDVYVSGSVEVPTKDAAKIGSKTVTLTPGTKTVNFTAEGTVPVLVAQSGTLTTLTGKGTISIPTVTGGKLEGATATGNVTYSTVDKAECGDISGTVPVPTAGTLKNAKAAGDVKYSTVDTVKCDNITGTVNLPNGGNLTGATATGEITYDAYPTAKCDAITASVKIPTKGTFSGTPTGIKAAWQDVGSFKGSITLALVTGGSLDASCNFVPTVQEKTFQVVFSGTPSIGITSQGTVSGDVSLTTPETGTKIEITTPTITPQKEERKASPASPFKVSGGSITLTGSVSTQLSINTPTLTPNMKDATTKTELPVSGGSIELGTPQNVQLSINKPTITTTRKNETANPTLNVSGGTFTPTVSESDKEVTVFTQEASVTINNVPENKPISVSGEIQAPTVTSAELADDEVILEPGSETADLNLNVVKKKDFLIYLRPRA
jgi:hypothetical protein